MDGVHANRACQGSVLGSQTSGGLAKTVYGGGSRLKHLERAAQLPGDGIFLPWGLVDCVLTVSDKVDATTTAKLLCVANGLHEDFMEWKACMNQHSASDVRKGSIHGN